MKVTAKCFSVINHVEDYQKCDVHTIQGRNLNFKMPYDGRFNR